MTKRKYIKKCDKKRIINLRSVPKKIVTTEEPSTESEVEISSNMTSKTFINPNINVGKKT